MNKPKLHFWSGKKALAYSASLLIMTAAQPALAQIEQQTGIADPGRVQEQIRSGLVAPQVGPDIEVREMQLLGAPPGSENITFAFGGLDLEGASAYEQAEFAPIYEDKIGTTISLADLYGIANQMTLKYRNDGYILTQVVVPPQTIENGIARLQIVEGYIDTVTVQADEDEGASAVGTIRDYASQIGTGGATNVKDLEHWLLLINDLPGVNARSIISPSRTTPGAADLLVIVSRDPFDALASMDNFGSRYLGPVQFSGAATLNSWLGHNDAIGAQVVVAPDDREMGYLALTYEQPIGPYGTKISGLMSYTVTEPGYDLDPFDVKGYSDLYSIKVTHPFIRARSTNLTGRVLFDWRDVDTTNNLIGDPTREDRIRALRAGLRYEFLDSLFGVAINAFDVEISKGLNVFGSSDEGDANMTRAFGDPTFTKAEAEIQRLQRITDDVNLLVIGRGQWSSDALLSSEEFAIGGISSVRGFDPSEVTGDDGISGTAEVQWNEPMKWQFDYIDHYQLFGFFDAGRVWNQDAVAGDSHDSLTSAGGGVRVNFTGETDAGLAIAWPLNRDVLTQGDDDPKVYFNLSKRF